MLDFREWAVNCRQVVQDAVLIHLFMRSGLEIIDKDSNGKGYIHLFIILKW